MKKIFKSKIFLVLVTALFVGTISVFADDILEATGIKYKNKSVEDSLNELYIKANAKDVGALKFCKFIDGTYGSFGEIGSKYECDPGDGVTRNFYLLAKNNDNSVDLIMDRNITQGTSSTTMSWINAMSFFDNTSIAEGLGVNVKTDWDNVLNVNLPKVQAIADAVGYTKERMAERGYTGWFYFDSKTQSQTANASNLSNYRWLFNYTKGCSNYGCDDVTSLGDGEAYGYWTQNMIANNINHSWDVYCRGSLDYGERSATSYFGVRPVITVLKTNLYSE